MLIGCENRLKRKLGRELAQPIHNRLAKLSLFYFMAVSLHPLGLKQPGDSRMKDLEDYLIELSLDGPGGADSPAAGPLIQGRYSSIGKKCIHRYPNTPIYDVAIYHPATDFI